MKTIHQFHGVGDRVVDALLVYSLSDLARKADAHSTIEWSLGHDIILTLSSFQSRILDKMLDALRRSGKSVTTANRLSFWLNVGGGRGTHWKVDPIACTYCAGKRGKVHPCDMRGDCGRVSVPAYSIFYRNLGKVEKISWPDSYTLSKYKQETYQTLYVGLSPYWSKGVRRWDSRWDSSSTYLPAQIQILLLYGLSNYAITASGDMFTQLILLPPFGMHLGSSHVRQILELLKRIVSRFGLGLRGIRITELTARTIPLVLLSSIDLASLAGLSRERLSLLFIRYDLDRGVPKNARGYEEQYLEDIANFYLRLGSCLWDFKCMIGDLASQVWRKEFKGRIESVLINLSYAISRRDVWLLNDALLSTRRLLDEGLRIHLPARESALTAQQVLKAF
jgi:hypothetical protein